MVMWWGLYSGVGRVVRFWMSGKLVASTVAVFKFFFWLLFYVYLFIAFIWCFVWGVITSQIESLTVAHLY